MQLGSNWIVYGLLASIIASMHLWIGWFESRFERFENLWIGFIGGIAVGYATLYMLPKLSKVTSSFITANPDVWSVLQYRAYFILLLGIVVYLIFERASRMSAGGAAAARWLEIAVLGLYGFLVGYVAAELPRSKIALHVLANVILALTSHGHGASPAHALPVRTCRLVPLRVRLANRLQLRAWDRHRVARAVRCQRDGFHRRYHSPERNVRGVTKGKEGRLRYFLVGVSVFALVLVLMPRS